MCKGLKPKEIFLIKVKTRPRPPKTPHLNMPHISMSLCWKICITLPKCLYKERRCNCSIVTTAAMLWRFSITRLRNSANHNALDSWPMGAHCAFQNNGLCKNRCDNEWYENNVFFCCLKHNCIIPNTQNNVIFSIVI